MEYNGTPFHPGAPAHNGAPTHNGAPPYGAPPRNGPIPFGALPYNNVPPPHNNVPPHFGAHPGAPLIYEDPNFLIMQVTGRTQDDNMEFLKRCNIQSNYMFVENLEDHPAFPRAVLDSMPAFLAQNGPPQYIHENAAPINYQMNHLNQMNSQEQNVNYQMNHPNQNDTQEQNMFDGGMTNTNNMQEVQNRIIKEEPMDEAETTTGETRAEATETIETRTEATKTIEARTEATRTIEIITLDDSPPASPAHLAQMPSSVSTENLMECQSSNTDDVHESASPVVSPQQHQRYNDENDDIGGISDNCMIERSMLSGDDIEDDGSIYILIDSEDDDRMASPSFDQERRRALGIPSPSNGGPPRLDRMPNIFHQANNGIDLRERIIPRKKPASESRTITCLHRNCYSVLAKKSSSLMMHARRHCPEKQYSCPLCAFTHEERSRTYTHLLSVHGNKSYIPVDHKTTALKEKWEQYFKMCFPGFQYQKTKTYKKRKPSSKKLPNPGYTCKTCKAVIGKEGNPIDVRDELVAHVNNHHMQEVRLYKCEICQYPFFDRTSAIDHVEVNHLLAADRRPEEFVEYVKRNAPKVLKFFPEAKAVRQIVMNIRGMKKEQNSDDDCEIIAERQNSNEWRVKPSNQIPRLPANKKLPRSSLTRSAPQLPPQTAPQTPRLPKEAHDHPEKSPQAHHHPEKSPQAHHHPEMTPQAHHHPEMPPPAHHHPEMAPRANRHSEMAPQTHHHPVMTPQTPHFPNMTSQAYYHPMMAPQAPYFPRITSQAYNYPVMAPQFQLMTPRAQFQAMTPQASHIQAMTPQFSTTAVPSENNFVVIAKFRWDLATTANQVAFQMRYPTPNVLRTVEDHPLMREKYPALVPMMERLRENLHGFNPFSNQPVHMLQQNNNNMHMHLNHMQPITNNVGNPVYFAPDATLELAGNQSDSENNEDTEDTAGETIGDNTSMTSLDTETILNPKREITEDDENVEEQAPATADEQPSIRVKTEIDPAHTQSEDQQSIARANVQPSNRIKMEIGPDHTQPEDRQSTARSDVQQPKRIKVEMYGPAHTQPEDQEPIAKPKLRKKSTNENSQNGRTQKPKVEINTDSEDELEKYAAAAIISYSEDEMEKYAAAAIAAYGGKERQTPAMRLLRHNIDHPASHANPIGGTEDNEPITAMETNELADSNMEPELQDESNSTNEPIPQLPGFNISVGNILAGRQILMGNRRFVVIEPEQPKDLEDRSHIVERFMNAASPIKLLPSDINRAASRPSHIQQKKRIPNILARSRVARPVITNAVERSEMNFNSGSVRPDIPQRDTEQVSRRKATVVEEQLMHRHAAKKNSPPIAKHTAPTYSDNNKATARKPLFGLPFNNEEQMPRLVPHYDRTITNDSVLAKEPNNTSNITTEEAALDVEEAQNVAVPAASTGRKRGRPPKKSRGSCGSVQLNLSACSDGAIPAKRGRGRPRKYPRLDDSTASLVLAPADNSATPTTTDSLTSGEQGEAAEPNEEVELNRSCLLILEQIKKVKADEKQMKTYFVDCNECDCEIEYKSMMDLIEHATTHIDVPLRYECKTCAYTHRELVHYLEHTINLHRKFSMPEDNYDEHSREKLNKALISLFPTIDKETILNFNHSDHEYNKYNILPIKRDIRGIVSDKKKKQRLNNSL